jgi:hypothetical protein
VFDFGYYMHVILTILCTVVSNLGKPSQIRLDNPLSVPTYQLSFPPELQKAYLRFNNLILSLGKCPASDA